MKTKHQRPRPRKKSVSLTLDSRNRVCLTQFIPEGLNVTSYQAYQEGDKIILEPMSEIPAREAWLYTNPEALASVLEGLKQAEAGQVSELKMDFSKFLEDDENF